MFATLTHEIGHVLGAWMGDREGYDAHTDSAAGTWARAERGWAVHGGPAPFQDAADPQAWVDGERDPLASAYDFAHSGVCVSLLSYCRQNAALPAFLPHAIDLAFLADLGMDRNASDRQARDLRPGGLDRLRRVHPFPVPRVANRPCRAAAVLRRGGESVAPSRRGSTCCRWKSMPSATAPPRRAPRPCPAPPVTPAAWSAPPSTARACRRSPADATLTLDLGTLDGNGQLHPRSRVYPDGRPETFAGGALHYPLALSGNAIAGHRDRFHAAGGLLRPRARGGGRCSARPARRPAGQFRCRHRRPPRAART